MSCRAWHCEPLEQNPLRSFERRGFCVSLALVTQILLSPLIQEAAGGVNARARLTARPTYTTQVDGANVRFGQIIAWEFNGIILPVITLEEPQLNAAWVLELTVGSTTITRTVRFTGSTARWDQLVDVDPATLDDIPTGDALASWIAVRDAILAAPKIPGPPGPPGVTGAHVEALEPTQYPTASVANGILSLGIPAGIPGLKGDKGDKGDPGQMGPAGLTFRGSWSNTTDYAQDDSVYYNGASWFAMSDPTIGAVPGSDNAWVPLAIAGQKGDKGDPGTDGAPGTPGAPGSGILSVTANTLAAGSSATASLSNQALTLGIPQGAKGDKGDPGMNGAPATAALAYPASGTTFYATNWNDGAGKQTKVVVASDGTVIVQLGAFKASLIANGDLIGTLPLNARPTIPLSGIGQAYSQSAGAFTGFIAFTVNTDGTITAGASSADQPRSVHGHIAFSKVSA